jgi:hypothetical protein
MADAPIAYYAQPVEDSTSWVGYSYGLATVVAYLAAVAVALGTAKRESRPRVYRTAFFALIGVIGYLAVYALRTSGYLEQLVTAWDATVTVQAGWWDLSALGWMLVWLSAALLSYAPSVDVMHIRKQKRSSDEQGNSSINDAAEREALDITKNVHHWVPGHVLLNIVFNTFLFGSIALQQAYPTALWQLVAVGAVAIACLITYYILVAILVGRIPSMIGTADRKLYRAFIIFMSVFGAIAIIMPVMTACFSPAVATLQPTFSMNNVVWMSIATAFVESLLVFFAMYYFDFKHAKGGKSVKARKGTQ